MVEINNEFVINPDVKSVAEAIEKGDQATIEQVVTNSRWSRDFEEPIPEIALEINRLYMSMVRVASRDPEIIALKARSWIFHAQLARKDTGDQLTKELKVLGPTDKLAFSVEDAISYAGMLRGDLFAMANSTNIYLIDRAHSIARQVNNSLAERFGSIISGNGNYLG